VLADVRTALQHLDVRSVDYVTLSGSGEPTLHPELGSIIEGLRDLVNKPIAVLTNSSLVSNEEVRKGLAMADLVVAKLDAPNQPLLEAINRPARGVLHGRIVEGLAMLRGETRGELALQMMFLGFREGGRGNTGEETVEALVRLVGEIKPDEVQINTPTRPPSEGYVVTLKPDEINAIAGKFRLSTRYARVVSRYDKKLWAAPKRLDHERVEEEIVGLVQRRPCSCADIATVLNLPTDVVKNHLHELMKQDRLSVVRYEGEDYYKAS